MRKRFFIQIIIVLITAGICSSLYYYHLCNNLRHAGEGMLAKLDHVFYDSARYDVLFAGSSRVLKNIDPVLFDSLTKYHSYNAGIDGANFVLIDLLIRKFFKSHGHPKYLFINLDTYTMEHDTSFFFYTQFLPFMDDPDLQRMKEREPNLKTGSRYPFLGVSYLNDYLKEVAFYTEFNMCPAYDPVVQHRGFAPVMDTAFWGDSGELPLNFVYQKERLNELDSLCNFCTKKGCKVFFIMAPIYRSTETGSSNAATYYPQIREIENRYGIREFNFFTDSVFSKDLFLNRSHLNFKGAALYSHLLADSFNAN
jgi:hypothetical protein